MPNKSLFSNLQKFLTLLPLLHPHRHVRPLRHVPAWLESSLGRLLCLPHAGTCRDMSQGYMEEFTASPLYFVNCLAPRCIEAKWCVCVVLRERVVVEKMLLFFLPPVPPSAFYI